MPANVNIEVRAQVDDAIRGLTKVGSGFGDMKKMNQDAAGALGVFGVSLTALNNPLTLVAGTIKDSIDKTLNWANSIDKLSRAAGVSAEQTSVLATVFGDYGIEVDSLDKVIKTFTKNGLQFNMDTLKKLAKEYQAIEDPVKRNEFAFKNFGRSAQDMTEILSKTPAEFAKLEAAAKSSGKVMSQDAVDAAQEFSLGLAQLQDRIDGLQITIGGPLIKTLTTAATSLDQLFKLVKLGNIAFGDFTGQITDETAALMMQEVVNGATNSTMEEGNETRFTAIAQLQEYVPLIHATTGAYDGMIEAAKANTTAENVLTKATKDHSEASALLAAGLAGTMKNAQQSYKDVIAETTPEIARLTTEIAKYEKSQGASFTVTKEATTSQAEYELATIKAAEALVKFTEYTGDDREKQLELQVAADRAQESVIKLGEGFGYSKDFTVNHTKAIAEDKEALEALRVKNAGAVEQFDKTTASFILQQIAFMAGPEASLAAAHALGILNDTDYTLALNVRQSTKDWDLNKNGMIDAGREADGLANSLVNQKKQVEIAAGVLPPLTEHIGAVGGAANYAQERVHLLNEGINGLHDKTITVRTDFIGSGAVSGSGQGGFGSGAAGGADFIVPPGYPNDSYPLRVQSGEHVQVTPASQTTNNYTVNAAYGNQSEGSVARELALMSRLNR